jgi:hypothetical protein
VIAWGIYSKRSVELEEAVVNTDGWVLDATVLREN